ncbi:MAG: hypothetical protein PHH11_12085 [Methylomonas sp.]|nr:hypothetical protein [Methylomonas sp.]
MADLIDTTVDKLVQRGFDPMRSPFAHKVAVMLVTAQGIIDNGGFEYLFGNPFHQDTRLEDFIKVYEAVGAAESAEAFSAALRRWRDGFSDFDSLDVVLWENSDANYKKLEEYIVNHESEYV